jgi:hypothetical protein
VRLPGAGRDNDHHYSRDYYDSTTGCHAADHDYSQHRLLGATLGLQGARTNGLRALFSFFSPPGVSISAFASSSVWLTTGVMACNFSPLRKQRSFTPMALRPVSRISFTRVAGAH